MRQFDVAALPRLVFAGGAIARLAPICAERRWSRVLLIVGRSAIGDPEFRSGLERSFGESDVTIVARRYDLVPEGGRPGASPTLDDLWQASRGSHPEASSAVVDAIVDSVRTGVDAVVAIGGGSAIDIGKAVSAMLATEGSVEEYLEGVGTRTPPGAKVPFVAVPTTAGTGSEATKNAVLSRVGDGGYKKSLRHDAYVPDIAIVDPQLALSCPRALTAASGLDAITQLIESYVSRDASPFTDALALDGLAAAGRSFRRCVERGDADLEAREQMAYAAYLSGICLASAGLGTVHGLAGAAGAVAAVPHGAICGLLLPGVTAVGIERLRRKRDSPGALSKYASVGVALTGGPAGRPAGSLEDRLEALVRVLSEYASLSSLAPLRSYGLAQDDLTAIARAGGNKANPYEFSVEEREQLLYRVF